MAINLGDGFLNITGDPSSLENTLRGMSSRAGRLLLGMGASITAFVASTIVAAGDFESAFAGVRKTLDATEQDFQDIRKEIKNMSEEIPLSAVGIAKLAELGGQLGISKDGIEEFTRTIADLASSTNITGEAGAIMVAQFANIVNLPEDQIDNFASALVDLGNNSAATEQAILSMALRIGAAGANAGLSAADILAMAAALSSVGIQAELGGTAFSRVVNTIDTLVRDDNLKGIQIFADAANMSAEGFKQLFKDSPAKAIEEFFLGLKRVNEQGGSVSKIVESIGLRGTRMADVLQRAGRSSEFFGESIERSNDAFEKNIALTEEAEKRYKTFNSRVSILKNTFVNLLATVGDLFLPKLTELANTAKIIVQNFRRWIEENQELTKTLLKIATATGIFFTVMGALAIVVPSLIALFAILVSPIGLVIGAISGLVAAITFLIVNFVSLEQLKSIASGVFDFLVSAYENIRASTEELFTALSHLFETGLILVKTIAIGILDAILIAFGTSWDELVGDTESFSETFFILLNSFISLLKNWANDLEDILIIVLNFWNTHGEKIKSIVGTLTNSVILFFRVMINSLTILFSGLSGLFRFLENPVRNTIEFLERMFDRAQSIVEGIISLVNFVTGETGTPGRSRSAPSSGPSRSSSARAPVNRSPAAAFESAVSRSSNGANQIAAGDRSLSVSFDGAVIQTPMDLDTVVQEITNQWDIITQQGGGSTAISTG